MLHQTLLPLEADTMDLAISQDGLDALAMKFCEMRADIRRLDAEAAEHTREESMHAETNNKLGKLRMRLCALETNGETYQMREELCQVQSLLDIAE